MHEVRSDEPGSAGHEVERHPPMLPATLTATQAAPDKEPARKPPARRNDRRAGGFEKSMSPAQPSRLRGAEPQAREDRTGFPRNLSPRLSSPRRAPERRNARARPFSQAGSRHQRRSNSESVAFGLRRQHPGASPRSLGPAERAVTSGERVPHRNGGPSRKVRVCERRNTIPHHRAPNSPVFWVLVISALSVQTISLVSTFTQFMTSR